MSNFKTKSFHIYPIKSLGGQKVKNPKATLSGFEYDRQWMLVDEEGKFQTQREFPKMALLAAKVIRGRVTCFEKNNVDNKISFKANQILDEKIKVNIWSDKLKAHTVDTLVDEWFSDQLKCKVRLVYKTNRKKYIHKFNETYPTNYPDAYPYLVLSTNSLKEINSHLNEKIGLERFRANIIIEGDEPFFEDTMEDFKIGSIPFKMVKRCGRCIVINTDQETSKVYKEPLKSLAKYRRFRKKVMVGMNAVALMEGNVIE